MSDDDLKTQARLAASYVVSTIECEAWPLPREGVTWYDTAPMLSEREHSGELIDENRAILAYGERMGLIVVHPTQRGLVRIVARSAT